MTIEEDIGRLLTEKGLTLSVAESCTGGLISHRITNVPGSSVYYLGGVVSYSNDCKLELLGVTLETIEQHGAVSEQCAKEMAEGVRKLTDSHIAIASTGIAGPGGGTEDKPVGLVYIAVAAITYSEVVKLQLSGTREEIKQQTSEAALTLLRSHLLPMIPGEEGI